MTAFIDARQADIAQLPVADLCIVGAGAAGITLALEMAARNRSVLLVEAGAYEIEGKTQALYVAPNTGVPYYDLAACRLRYFGGTTNHWSGFCRANDPIDYEGRPEIGLPAWPVQHDALLPYLERAATILGIQSNFFSSYDQFKAKGLDPELLMDRHSKVLVTKNFQLAKNIRFRTLFRKDIEGNPNIHPVENLNVVEIKLDEGGKRVDHLLATTTDGKTTQVRAKAFALCCHAIENARILLSSDSRMPGGIGNRHDHVGRYFMEHPHVFASRMIPSDKFPRAYDRFYLQRYGLNANLGITEAELRKHGIMNYYCRFNPVSFRDSEQLRAARKLPAAMMKPATFGLFRDMAKLLSNLPGTTNSVLRQFDQERAPLYYQLEHRIEQAPNRDSRVTIGAERDKLGQRPVTFHWALSDLDVKTINVGQDIIVRELSALNMGRFEVESITMDMLKQRVLGHYHHTGTTRMSENPSDGVVDANLKVHDVDNLYVGGSSVFPTTGYSGPTMTLIALSVRLAEHLSGGLGKA
ncbi:GMC oxidoreductase [Sphingobium sp. B2]|uniref:GMC oxidoreductase n=1 Tax=Sphingobium sp. B2 TaxID=2583228 RepID=UPI0011A459B9|nr:GMC family oxidoreductase [Sphingobium sp. B2]